VAHAHPWHWTWGGPGGKKNFKKKTRGGGFGGGAPPGLGGWKLGTAGRPAKLTRPRFLPSPLASPVSSMDPLFVALPCQLIPCPRGAASRRGAIGASAPDGVVRGHDEHLLLHVSASSPHGQPHDFYLALSYAVRGQADDRYLGGNRRRSAPRPPGWVAYLSASS